MTTAEAPLPKTYPPSNDTKPFEESTLIASPPEFMSAKEIARYLNREDKYDSIRKKLERNRRKLQYCYITISDADGCYAGYLYRSAVVLPFLS